MANSVTIWQTFRDAYSKSVIFGKQAPAQALDQASSKVEQLAAGRRLSRWEQQHSSGPGASSWAGTRSGSRSSRRT